MELIKAYDAMNAATGPDRQKTVAENSQKIFDLHKENIWLIAYLSPSPVRFLISNELKNFPENVVNCDEYRWGSMMRPEQLYKTN